jgi:YVTN family beta-propeller protein
MTGIKRILAAALALAAGGWGCSGSGAATGGTGGASDASDAGDASPDRPGDDARPGDGGGAEADGGAPGPRAVQSHSSPIAVNPAGTRLYVVHPDADSVSMIDLATRAILHEVLLGSKPVAVDSAGRYTPAVGPRALALDSTGRTLYVTGQRSGHLYALDASSGAMLRDAFVCSEPIGVLVGADDAGVFVACSQDDQVVQVHAADLTMAGAAPGPRKPWALAWAADGKTLLATHLLGPGVSAFKTGPLAFSATWTLDEGPPSADDDPTEPHGPVRGIYDAAVRPGTSELWVAHIMLGIDTPQPDLNFQQTVFPALSIFDDTGAQQARLSVATNPGDGQAFGDIVSGPHAIAFSDDGRLVFVADSDSEDVLIVDADRRVESQIIRPLPGHTPEGIVWAGGKIYVQERNSEDVVAFAVARSAAGIVVTPDGAAFPTLAADPMPATLRLGQRLFYSANSDQLPLTQNHWVACATCHLEGRSDAVTWKFAQGPRDTPTNAGGLLDTGFLFRTADRNRVQDYWRTINVEQGGHFSLDNPSQKTLLDALATFVNYAIPAPVPPSTDASHTLQGQALADLRAQGQTVFVQVGCPNCHSGPALTDSGAGNPTLDLTGTVVSTQTAGGVLLHDVGTCAQGNFPDVDHQDILGDERAACVFDTPSLRGLADSAPYLHDGSAATLDDVVPIMLQASAPAGQTAPTLTADQQRALVEYLRGL